MSECAHKWFLGLTCDHLYADCGMSEPYDDEEGLFE